MAERVFHASDYATSWDLDEPALFVEVGVDDNPEQIIFLGDVALSETAPLTIESLVSANSHKIQPAPNLIRGMTLHYPISSVPDSLFALDFSTHLLATRRHRQPLVLPSLTSMQTPEVPQELVRLPHLVVVADTDGTLTDKVIWEIMDHKTASWWLGGVMPDTQRLETLLPALLRIKQDVRRNDAAYLEEHPGIYDRLQHGRYLSVLLVCQQLGEFEAVCDTML
ncbi:hypothetical protein BH09PAT3_BH09PAT3_5100 [soil metagenome]